MEAPNCAYTDDREQAILIGKNWSIELEGEQYVEVWKQDKNGNYGDSGKPIYKSDEVTND
jgi:hypothetical protein